MSLPNPVTRVDMYLAYLSGTLTLNDLPDPVSRAELFLYYLCLKGGTGGGTSGVSSVNTRTGAVTLTKSDVGLGNVPNTDATNASNISSGTLADGRLSTNVTTQGNVFNTANTLCKLDASGKVAAANLPIGLVTVQTVSNQTNRLTIPKNNTNLMIALQADTKIEYAINAGLDPAVDSNWVNCGSYASSVLSVNNSTGAVTIDLASLGGVPTTRTVNNKALSGNITLAIGDIITLNSNANSYLGGDGAFHVLPSGTGTMTGATSTADGTSGTVPKPTTGQQNYFLKGDGTWADLISMIYPIGHIIMTENANNPSTYLGIGTWVAYGAGRVPVSIDTSQTEFNIVGKTGGEKSHILTIGELPSHNHANGSFNKLMTVTGSNTSDGVVDASTSEVDLFKQGTIATVGNNQAHNNLQPYIVCYMWKRTA